MARVIVFTSGKGGVGKTTCVANVGRALASLGRRTVCVEGDIGLNNLDVALGVEDRVLYDAGEVVRRKATIEQCLVEVADKLFLLPVTTCSVSSVSTDDFVGIVRRMKEDFDYILIDSPAGIEDGFHRSVVGAEEAILVTTPHLTSVRDAYKTVRFLSGYGIQKIGLIVNRVRGEYVLDRSMLSPGDIAKTLRLSLCGVLPEDDFINLHGFADVTEQSTGVGYSFYLIAQCIDTGEKKLYDCTRSQKSLKNRIKRWFS